MSIHDYTGPKENNEDEEEYMDLPINPEWELQQKQTFTAWCNSHLNKINKSIENIETDFRDGHLLIKLLEALSGDKMSRPEKGNMRFHKIANVNKALTFIESKGVKLVSIGAEEIVDGNVKMTLGMIWTIILRFAIQDIQMEDRSAKEGLLLWCKRQTEKYSNVSVKNFHTSFKDGLAFCAIIHNNRRDLIDYANLDKNDSLNSLNTAFDVAATKLGIPKMLNAEVMANSVKPDELSVMAYVSSYYHLFAGARKANLAATRISNVLKVNREINELIEEYDKLASDLLKWINQKLKEFSVMESQDKLDVVEALQNELRNYQKKTKPKKFEEKANLETTYNTLQTKLRLNNRPPYVPEADKLLSSIDAKWKELEVVDKAFEIWVVDELIRLRRLAHLLKAFNTKCLNYDQWASDKPTMLAHKDYRNASVADLRALKKKHEAFEPEMNAQFTRLNRIKVLQDEIAELKYHDVASVNERYNKTSANCEEIHNLYKAREKELSNVLVVLEKIDELYLDFAKLAATFNTYLQNIEEDLNDSIIVDSAAESKRLSDEQEKFVSSLDTHEAENSSIQGFVDEVKRLMKENGLGDTLENPYTNVTHEELPVRWANVKKLSETRGVQLDKEKQRLAAVNEICLEFAKLATEFDAWIVERKSKLSRNALEASGTLETQLEQISALQAELVGNRSRLEKLEHVNQQLEDAFVYENPHTTHTMPSLRVAWDQLFTSLQHSINAVENQILMRDSKGISSDQMNDLRKTFAHFDTDKSLKLDPHEFKSCLVSLGHSFSDDPSTGESEFNRIMQQVDVGNKGYVTFDAFIDYTTREESGEDTEEHILHSFKTMAGEKGYITAEDIHQFLAPDDAEYCLKHMHPLNGPNGDSGALNYEEFVNHVYGKNSNSGA